MSVILRQGFNYTKYRKPRYCWGLNTLFTLPDQGVYDFQVLSRGSLFVVKSNVPGKKYHFITTAHITHPFNFRNLYPEQDWLSVLREEDTMYQLHIREFESGKSLTSFDFWGKSFKHPTLDLAILHLQDENKFEHKITQQFQEPLQTLELSESSVFPGLEVDLIGHDLMTNSEGEEVLVPASLPGTVNMIGKKKHAISTQHPSVMGLCGGPVVVQGNKCIGMVECLAGKPKVPNEAAMRIEGNTLIVTAQQIFQFVDETENTLRDLNRTQNRSRTGFSIDDL